jgi:hypothetical protein
VPAAVCVSLAAWLSSGVLAFRATPGARLGALPIAFAPIALALLVGALSYLAGRRDITRAALAVAPLLLVVLPWLPAQVPPAFLIWTGALTIPIWIGVSIALAFLIVSGDGPGSHAVSVRRELVSVTLAGCVVFSAAAWFASPSIPGGDEPHYLVITQSLLYDHDLIVDNNYARGDYHAYFGGPLNPDFRARGRHGEIYSIHAPGVPALVLPAFAIGGYHGVVIFLILVSAAACTLTWWLAWRATGDRGAAWFGWAAVALSAPFLLESFTVYPDGPGAALVLTGFWALQRLDANQPGSLKSWTWHGAALAALPWMHTRFVLLSIVLGAFIALRLMRVQGGGGRLAAFLSVPIVSTAAWFLSFYVMYGTLNPSAPYGTESNSAIAFLPNGLGGLLLDQGFGLLATAPVFAVAFAGLVRTRRFAVEWVVTAIVYGSAVASYAMWWAGTSGPARFLVPILLPLAIPAAYAWRSASTRAGRAIMVTALAASLWLSCVLAGGGGGMLGYHGRNVYGATAAPWLSWANPLVDLSEALPAFVPLPDGTPLGARITAAKDGLIASIPWALCFAAALEAVLLAGRRRDASPQGLIALCVAGSGVAVMAAASIVWWMHGSRPLTLVTAQLDLLRRGGDGPMLMVDLTSPQRLRGVEALKMRIEMPVESDDRSPATLASIPLLSAGSYDVSLRGSLRGDGSIVAGADDEPFVLDHVTPADFARGLALDLPVTVRALTIRAATNAGVAALEMRPVAPRTARASDRVAHHAARYGETRVFFVDDRTAPEGDGFWVWGAREGWLVFESSAASVNVVVRNGAAPNDVAIRAGDREQRLTLAPGEERPVTIPASGSGAAFVTTIRTSGGFRPSDVDSHSQDRRYLGVYVVMPEHAVR